LNSFFEVALIQNWVKPADILSLKGEYDSLKNRLSEQEPISSEPEASKEMTIFNHNNSERKDKIMTFLKEKDKVQVWQVKEILPEVSKRTLRRDFEDMVGQGLVERVGEKNDTFYKIKTQES
jgi:predicted HTH transcriptional regulator